MMSTHTSLEDLFVKTSEDHVQSSLDLVKSRHQVEFGHMFEAFSGLFKKFVEETNQIVHTFSVSVEEMTTAKEES